MKTEIFSAAAPGEQPGDADGRADLLRRHREQIALSLRSRRQDAGLSKSEAARVIGVSPQTYSSYEHGDRAISADQLCVLALRYQTSPDALAGFAGLEDDDRTSAERHLISQYRTMDSRAQRSLRSIADVLVQETFNAGPRT